jgi:ATP synthase F1 delta subunit
MAAPETDCSPSLAACSLSLSLSSELFQESSKAKNLSEVRAEMKKFRQLYEESAALRSMFLNPLVTPEKRKAALDQVFKAAKINTKQAQAFINAAAQTKALGRIKQVVADFDKLVTFELKEVHATVTSAEALQPQQVKRLESALKNKINNDETLILETKVDPTILGGLVVNLDQQMLDLSVTAQIRKLDAAIRAN